MTGRGTALRLVVIGASGAAGRLVVDDALARGHEVHAVVRDPARWDHAASPHLTVHRGDVHDPASVAAAITPGSVVVSALGVRTRAEAGTLTAGARAVLAAHPAAVVWLGAIGTGRSARAVGRLVHLALRVGFGAEYADKTTADGLVLDAGGTVVHAGPLTDRPAGAWTADPLGAVRRRLVPLSVPRAAAARVLLDEAESQAHPGGIVVPRPVA